MFHCGESYTGERTPDGKRMNGTGVLTFSSSNEYKGCFDDGRFHGEGIVHFTDEQGGGQYRATWESGEAEKGDYVFVDGLQYSTSDWQYCTKEDRRLWKEHLTFISPTVSEKVTFEDVIFPNYGDLPPE